METVKQAIRERVIEDGFDTVGFSPAELPPGASAGLATFLADGRQAGMEWMETGSERRSNPCALMPSARTVIALAANYGPDTDPRAKQAQPTTGAIAAYASDKDYHDVLKKRLKHVARWMTTTYSCDVKVFVDTAPVMEKPLAQQAGIGWQGKHTNLVSRRFGSWLFLGEIFTDLDLPADSPEPDHCGQCDRCLRACPTQALPEPHRIDPRRCISYLTIEHKEDILEELRAPMGNRIYGCDDCLAACPWNKFAIPTQELVFRPRPAVRSPRLADLVELDDDAFRRMFSGSPIKRTGRDRFIRNVLIAIGNSGDPALRPAAERRLSDASPLVREAARWAVERLPEDRD